MKERPILFSTNMVKAILAGSKTQTRRICKTLWPVDFVKMETLAASNNSFEFLFQGKYKPVFGAVFFNQKLNRKEFLPCPYGKVGDILWIRETWTPFNNGVAFKADEKINDKHGWRPSIHMPKAAARIWLQLEDVRVERVREITEEDAIAEGVLKLEDGRYHSYLNGVACQCETAKLSYTTLWCQINGTDSWNSNPWVWGLTFKLLSITGKPTPEPRPEETEVSIKPTAEEQHVVTESLKNVPGAGVPEFDPDQL
jgi:hypothetical protein